MHEHSFESQGHANAPALTPALGERGAPDAVLKPEALVASTGASPAQQPTAALAEDTQPARSDAVPDEPTTAWTSSVAHANAAQPELNEEATTIYIASKEQPAEPSVIIQDQDESNLYLRAKTGSSVNLAGTDERTVMCQRPSQQEFARYLVRQRFLWRLALVLGLVFASALLTLILARLRG
jgi:hypothetical protein